MGHDEKALLTGANPLMHATGLENNYGWNTPGKRGIFEVTRAKNPGYGNVGALILLVQQPQQRRSGFSGRPERHAPLPPPPRTSPAGPRDFPGNRNLLREPERGFYRRRISAVNGRAEDASAPGPVNRVNLFPFSTRNGIGKCYSFSLILLFSYPIVQFIKCS